MPVVTTDYPTMNEWIDDNIEGRLIKPKKVKKGSMPMDKVIIDPSHLAEIMIDYISNPKRCLNILSMHANALKGF